MPINGAVRYIQICCRLLLINAGAIDLAGFIEAPQIGPAKLASSNTTIDTNNALIIFL